MIVRLRLIHLAIAALVAFPFGATAQSVDAGDDVVLECESPNGTEYTLNGAAPIGVGIVNAWSTVPEVALDNADSLTPTGLFPLGVTTVTLTSTPDEGTPDSDDATVTVQDTQPPVVRITANPEYLWPPNHTMHSVAVRIDVQDLCGDAESFEIALIDVRSDEPDNGNGDGNTINDIQGADIGSDDRSIMLRAERAGGGNGRIYTLTYQVTDGSGNGTEAEAIVYVPHDASDIKDRADGGNDGDDLSDLDTICRRPASAVEKLEEIFPELGSVNDEPICNNICGAWEKSCDQIARGSERCVKGEEKSRALIELAECKDSDDRSSIQSCVAEVKTHLAAQKADLAEETRDARDHCAEMGQSCANACSNLFD